MSQESVERVLGRMITDEQFRRLANNSLDVACLQEGYLLTPTEVRLLSSLEFQHVTELAGHLNPGLCRAGVNLTNRKMHNKSKQKGEAK